MHLLHSLRGFSLSVCRGHAVAASHNDWARRRTESSNCAFDPVCGGLAQPAAVPIAVCTNQLSGVRLFAWADDAYVAVARPLTVDGAVELDAHPNDWGRAVGEEVLREAHGDTSERGRSSAISI